MFTTIKKAIANLKFLWSAFKEYRNKLILTAGLSLLGGFFGGIGISAIIPLFSIIVKQDIPGTNGIVRGIEYVFSIFHIPITLPSLLVFIILLFVMKGALRFYTDYLTGKTIADLEEKIADDLFKKTLSARWEYLLNQKVGHLERIILNDVNKVAYLLNGLYTTVILVANFITYAAIAFTMSLFVTISTIVFGIIFLTASMPLMSRIRRIHTANVVTWKEFSHHISEHTIGAKMIKATAVEHSVINQTRAYLARQKQLKILNTVYNSIPRTITEPVSFIFISLLFVFTYRTPNFNIATFAVSVYLIGKMFTFIQSAQGQMNSTNELIPYFKSINDYRKKTLEHQESNFGKNLFLFEKELLFKNVSFSYNPNRPLLKDINFSIKKGSITGIVGSSGSGKTTIVDLILRLFISSTGEIILDNTNIEQVNLDQWRKHIAYVPQEVFLLNSTIADNIRFYDDAITEEELIKATKAAQIYNTIKNMPDKFETIVGERGIKLSGGQRQRIALARALARKPDILILDEATSALDHESERLIQDSIETLKGTMTIIIVAHRLSTIMSADHLIVLKNGAIIEKGAPEELLNKEGSYLHGASHFWSIENDNSKQHK